MALDLHHLCTTWPAIPSHSPPPRLRHSPGTQNRPVRVPFPGVDGEARCGEPQRFYGLAHGGIGDAVVRAKLDDPPRSTSTSQNANGTCSVQADGAWRSGIQNIERRKMGASTSCSVSPLSVSQRPDACMFKSQLPWFSRTVHVAISISPFTPPRTPRISPRHSANPPPSPATRCRSARAGGRRRGVNFSAVRRSAEREARAHLARCHRQRRAPFPSQRMLACSRANLPKCSCEQPRALSDIANF
jgi:hypothetical protein